MVSWSDPRRGINGRHQGQRFERKTLKSLVKVCPWTHLTSGPPTFPSSTTVKTIFNYEPSLVIRKAISLALFLLWENCDNVHLSPSRLSKRRRPNYHRKSVWRKMSMDCGKHRTPRREFTTRSCETIHSVLIPQIILPRLI